MEQHSHLRLHDPTAKPELPEQAESPSVYSRMWNVVRKVYHTIYPIIPHDLQDIISPELREEIMEAYHEQRITDSHHFEEITGYERMTNIVNLRFAHLSDKELRSVRIYCLAQIGLPQF